MKTINVNYYRIDMNNINTIVYKLIFVYLPSHITRRSLYFIVPTSGFPSHTQLFVFDTYNNSMSYLFCYIYYSLYM